MESDEKKPGITGAVVKRVLFFIILAGTAAALRFVLLNKSLWTPEAEALAAAAGNGPRDIVAKAAELGQPPLYYLLAGLWIKIAGATPAALRALSALLGVGFVMLMYPLGTRVFGRSASGFAVMAAAVLSPLAVYVSQAAQPDALFALLAAVQCWCFFSILKSSRKILFSLLWIAATLALLFTSDLAAAVLVCEIFFLAVTRKQRDRAEIIRWVVTFIICYAALKGLQHRLPDLAKVTLSTAPLPARVADLQYLISLLSPVFAFSGIPVHTQSSDGFTALIVFATLAAALCFASGVAQRREQREQLLFVTLYLAVAAFAVFTLSVAFNGKALWWRNAVAAPPALLLAGFLVNKKPSALLRVFAALLICIVNIIGIQAYLRAGYITFDWKNVAASIPATPEKPVHVLSLVPRHDTPIRNFYMDGDAYYLETATVSPVTGDLTLAPDVLTARTAYDIPCFLVITDHKSSIELIPLWIQTYFNASPPKTFHGLFKEYDLQTMKLCLKPELKRARGMTRDHFIEMLTGADLQGTEMKLRRGRVQFYFEAGYPELAEQEMHALTRDYGELPDTDATLCAIALKKAEKSDLIVDYQTALDRAENALKSDPGNVYVKLLKGEILFHIQRVTNGSEFESAETYFRNVMDDEAYCEDEPESCARAAYFMGEIRIRQDREKQALTFFEQAMDSSELGLKASYYLGVTHFKLKHYEEAVQYLQPLAGNPVFGPAAIYTMGISAYRLGRVRDAKSLLNAVLEDKTYGPPAREFLNKLERK